MAFEFYKYRIYRYASDHGAEINYILGSALNDLTNLRHNAGEIRLSTKAIIGVTVSWNYLDGVYNFMLALGQFLDTSDYRYWTNVLKGLINVFSGVQLFIFSYNPPLNAALKLQGPIALAGSSFALAMFTDLICNSIDFYNATKKTYFSGWLEEKIKEYQYALKQKYDTKDLVKNIRARCIVYTNQDPAKLKKLNKLFNRLLKDSVKNKTILEALPKDLDKISDKKKERDRRIQYEVEQSYRINRTLIFIKAMSMFGMIFLAVSSFINSAKDITPHSVLLSMGLALTTLTASYYLITNCERLADTTGQLTEKVTSKASSLYNGFFTSSCCSKSNKKDVFEGPVPNFDTSVVSDVTDRGLSIV